MLKNMRTHVRWIMGLIVVAFLLSTFLMYDSGSQRGSSDGMTDYEVAEVNGRRLMRSELDRIVRNYVESMGTREIASDDWPVIYQSALYQFAIGQQMTQEIRDSGIEVSDAEAEQSMKDFADQNFPTREAFYQLLQNSGITVEDYKKNVAQEMAAQRLIESSIGTIVVSEDEAVGLYDTMKNFLYRQPGGFNVSTAHFANQADAEKVRALLAEGKPWAEVTSGDAVASMDRIRASETPEFMTEYVFDGYLAPMKSLDIGAVSPVFEVASNDFVVGVKNELVEEKNTSYQEASADIRSMLERQQQQEAINSYNQALLSKANIVIHDHSLFPPEESEALPVTVTQTGEGVTAVTASSDVSADVTEAITVSAEASADAAPSSVLSEDETAVASGDSE